MFFSEASTLVYTNVGYNSFYAEWHWKKYSACDELCANFIRDARLCPELTLGTGLITGSVESAIKYQLPHIIRHLVSQERKEQ